MDGWTSFLKNKAALLIGKDQFLAGLGSALFFGFVAYQINQPSKHNEVKSTACLKSLVDELAKNDGVMQVRFSLDDIQQLRKIIEDNPQLLELKIAEIISTPGHIQR